MILLVLQNTEYEEYFWKLIMNNHSSSQTIPCSDSGGHGVGAVIPDRWRERTDTDGHPVRGRAFPCATTQPL